MRGSGSASNGPHHAHTYSNASPTPTSVAGQGNVPTSTTPLWRRDEAGSVLCNACGLFLKLHGRPRPISLKTDVIKSRNRVKSSTQNGRRKMQFTPHHALPPHHDLSTPPPHPSYRRISDQHMPPYPERSASPISRTGTPSLHPHHHHTHPGHHSHTAPPLTHHLFDPNMARSPSPLPVHGSHYQQSQSAPSTIANRAASPHPHAPTLPLPVPTINGRSHSPSMPPAPPPTQVAELRTRISELEVINELYKSQLQDMENARRRDADTIDFLRRENEDLRRSGSHSLPKPPAHDKVLQAPSVAVSAPGASHSVLTIPAISQQHLPPPPPPREPSPVNYATATGSIKRRRGRTLEKANEDTRPHSSKRRETGEFPRPELAAVRV